MLLLLVLLASYPKNHCQCKRVVFLCFQVFNLFWVNFCELCKVAVQFHSSASDHPVFPTPLIEETILLPLNILGPLVKYLLIVYVRVWFHWLVCLFLCQYHTIFTIALYDKFEIRKCDASSFILSQDYFGYSEVFCLFPYQF